MFKKLGAPFGRAGDRPARGREIPLAAYDRELKATLAGLPPQQRAAFAAACAERLYPAYAAFRDASGTNDAGLVRRALDLAWAGPLRGG